jgi:hypothetical protein
MAVENIDALSDEVIERRAFEAPERTDAKRREMSMESDPLVRADYRAAHNLLVGSNVRDRRGLVHKQFLQEGTEGEICARHALGRVLRRLANSRLDSELAAILILLAGHFDGKIGHRNEANDSLYKSKWPMVALAAERRVRFEDHPLTDAQKRISLAQVKNAWLQARSMFLRFARRWPALPL